MNSVIQNPIFSSPMAAVAMEINSAILATIKLQSHFKDLDRVQRMYFNLRDVTGAIRISANMRRWVMEMCKNRGIEATCNERVAPDCIFLNIELRKVFMTPNETEQYKEMLKKHELHQSTLR